MMSSKDECQQCAYLVNQLDSERRSNYRRQLRDELENGMKSQVGVTSDHDPLHPERPYGLPPIMALSGVKDIWEGILNYVDEPKYLGKLRGVCTLFRDLLTEKFRILKLLKVVELCVLYESLNYVRLLQRDLLRLRLLNRMTRRLFDKFFTRDKVEEFGRSRIGLYMIPYLGIGVHSGGRSQRKMHGTIALIEKHNFRNGSFALKRLWFEEDFLKDLELKLLRDSVERLLQLAGYNIRFLGYYTKQSSHDTYCILRKWILLLPNLEEVGVGIGGKPEPMSLPFEHFPTVPRLKKFHESETGGFSISHLAEILRANPTIQNLKISKSPGNRLEPLLSSGILQGLKLEVFSCHQSSVMPLIECRFNWPIRTLVLRGGPKGIPSKTLFEFLNQFRSTLKEALLDLYIRDNGGTLELPNLIRLGWYLRSSTDKLYHLLPLKNLEYLYIVAPDSEEFPYVGNGLEQRMIEYLEKFHVPRLFPAMRQIRTARQWNILYMESIWECNRLGGGGHAEQKWINTKNIYLEMY